MTEDAGMLRGKLWVLEEARARSGTHPCPGLATGFACRPGWPEDDMGGNRRARGKRSMGHRPKRPIRCIRQVPKPVAVKMRTETDTLQDTAVKSRDGEKNQVGLSAVGTLVPRGGGWGMLPSQEGAHVMNSSWSAAYGLS